MRKINFELINPNAGMVERFLMSVLLFQSLVLWTIWDLLQMAVKHIRIRRAFVKAVREQVFIEHATHLAYRMMVRAYLVEIAKDLNGGTRPELSILTQELWREVHEWGSKAARVPDPDHPKKLHMVGQLVQAQLDGQDPQPILQKLERAMKTGVEQQLMVKIDIAEIKALVQRGRELQEAQATKTAQAYKAKLERAITHLERDLAQHTAQSAAFRKQLEQIDPENPLVANSALRERLAAVAYSQFRRTRDWTVVREVGISFMDSKGAKGAVHGNVVDLTQELVHNMAQASAFRRQLEIADPHNPLHDSDMCAAVATQAYAAYVHDRSFDGVRDVGKTFLIVDEVQRIPTTTPLTPLNLLIHHTNLLEAKQAKQASQDTNANDSKSGGVAGDVSATVGF